MSSVRLKLALTTILATAACAPAGAEDIDPSVAAQTEAVTAAAGRGSVFARVPSPPGYPEGVAVVGSRVFVSGPAVFGTAGRPASQVLIFDRLTGASRGAITIQGEYLAAEHALSCITSDATGRLYVLSTQLGVLRLTPTATGYTQQTYAGPFPDLRPCGAGVTGACSPTSIDLPPLPNDLAFDAVGNLYVTDSTQATVYRIRPGGGAPAIWFQSPRLEGAAPIYIGANGIRVSPDQSKVYIGESFEPGTFKGYVYTLPRVAAPQASDLRVFHEYAPGDGPDGFAFSLTGKLHVALAGVNALSVLGTDGVEQRRITGPCGSAIPFDAPANIAFDGLGSALVTNHANVSNDATHFAVLKVAVGELGFPLSAPVVP